MKRFRKSIPLPPLAFGEEQAIHAIDPNHAAAAAARILGGIDIYEPATDATSFRHKISTLCVNGLELSAAASSPMRLGIKTPNETFLLAPFFGSTSLRIGDRQYQWGADGRAILLSNCDYRYGLTETRSVLIARIESAKLNDTIASMLGHETADRIDVCGERARLLDLRRDQINFMLSFRQFCNFVDALAATPAILEKIGVDDLFYRQIGCWLMPELLKEARPSNRSGRFTSGAVDAVCDAARSRLTKPLTKTEMERISGLSARGFQYAFMKRFGCSPMEWQRRERLHLAHERLDRAGSEIGVTEIAMDLGFSSSSRFAAYYRSMFGETPRETKRRRNNSAQPP